MDLQALASKYGGTVATPKPDLASLAMKYNGTPQTPAVQVAPTLPDKELQANADTATGDKLNLTPFGRTVLKPLIGFGQSIAGGLSSLLPEDWTGIGGIKKASQSTADDTMNLVNLIKDRKARGMNTSTLENALKSEVTPAQWKELYPSITKSAKQVIGEAGGTALLATSGGGLGAGKSLALGTASKVAPTLLKTVATGGAYGAAAGASNAAQNDASAKDIAIQSAAGGTIGAATGGLTYGFGKLLQKAGDKILVGTIKPTRSDIEDGFNLETIKKHNLGGSLTDMYDKTETRLGSLTHQLNRKLAASNETIDMNKVVEDTVKSLSGNKLKSFGSNTSVSSAVEQLKNEVAALSETGQLSIPDSQLVKQASGRMGAWQYGATDPSSTARQTVYNKFYSTLKTAIENASPEGVRDINKQIAELIPISNAIIRRIPIAERSSALSLPDMLTLTASILDPRALVGFGMSLAQKSGSVGNVLSKVGPKIAGKAPIVGAVAGYGTSKASDTLQR